MSCERARLHNYAWQPLDFIPRVPKKILIGLVERSQISILEIPEGAQDLRRFAIEHLLECAQASRQGHARGNHLGDIPIIFGFGAIECRLQLGRHQIVERCDKQCAVAGLKWIIDAAKADATEKRNLHQAGWHFGQHHQRVRRVLQDCCPANKSERVAYLILVERFISEKVEIERFSMSEMERDGCPPVEDKTQLRGGC